MLQSIARSCRITSFIGQRTRLPEGRVSTNRTETQAIWRRRLNFLRVSEVRFWENYLWLSNLPDLNLLDYHFYTQIEAKACESSCNSITVFSEDIKKVVRSLEM